MASSRCKLILARSRTLYDSKGLEFNDVSLEPFPTHCRIDVRMQVLLYNFFEDSAVDLSRWRVLLNHAEGEVDGKDLAKIPAPSFGRDDGRFAGVCSEACETRDIRFSY